MVWKLHSKLDAVITRKWKILFLDYVVNIVDINMNCPKCESGCYIINSKQITKDSRERQYLCKSKKCSFGFVTIESFIREVVKRDTPKREYHKVNV